MIIHTIWKEKPVVALPVVQQNNYYPYHQQYNRPDNFERSQRLGKFEFDKLYMEVVGKFNAGEYLTYTHVSDYTKGEELRRVLYKLESLQHLWYQLDYTSKSPLMIYVVDIGTSIRRWANHTLYRPITVPDQMEEARRLDQERLEALAHVGT